MKRLLLLLAPGALALIGGCAQMTAPGSSAQVDDVDYGKVNAITETAKTRGVGIYWYNMPKKHDSGMGAAAPGGSS